jgi:hypothetical protein
MHMVRSRVIVQVGAAKIYVTTVVEALKQNERQHETQVMPKELATPKISNPWNKCLFPECHTLRPLSYIVNDLSGVMSR